MKPDAALIEVFPYKYFKYSYIWLSKPFGIHHHWLLNQHPSPGSNNNLRNTPLKECMGNLKCRSYARTKNVTMPMDHINAVVDVMIQQMKRRGVHV